MSDQFKRKRGELGKVELFPSMTIGCSHYDKDEWFELFAQESIEKDGAIRRDQDPNCLNQRNASAAAEIYSPLPPDGMRLVRIHAGTGRLECTILVGPEEGAPKYGALSYVWGSQRDPEIISLNGRDYLVTKNLFAILLKLRSSGYDHIFWIDALVINQSDMEERATEVKKMLQRYSGAEGTLVWLCECDHVYPVRASSCGGFDIGSPFLRSISKEAMDEPESEHNLIARVMECILSSDYFRRAWVVQELMYSEKVTIHFGDLAVDMSTFLSHGEINEYRCEAPVGRTLVVGDRRLAIRPGFGRQEKYLTIPSWLGCYGRYRYCTNPRDSLFAYYGCFPPEAREDIQVDYDRPVIHMCHDITLAWISSEKNLDFLLQIGSRELWWRLRDSDPRSVPSWLPNYFGREKNCIGAVFAAPGHSYGPIASREPTAQFAEDNTLTIKGILLGTVKSLGKLPEEEWRFKGMGHFEPFDAFILDQIHKHEGSIMEMDPAVRNILSVEYAKSELAEKLQGYPDILERLKTELETMEEAEGLQGENARTLRLGERIASWRVPLCLDQAEGSRSIGTGGIDIPFGHGTPGIRTGDSVYAIIGCSLALVLRRVGSHHSVIGNSRVFGVLDGISLQNNPGLIPPDVTEDITLY